MTVEFWFLIGAALVFWMQAGFAMVETGFTRAKNAGNIIMKNLMDFCIGTVVFSLLGYTLMMGEDAFFGLIGKPNLDLFTRIDKLGIPLVWLHAPHIVPVHSPCVQDDNVGGAQLLTRYLLDKGHRDIAGIFKYDDLQGHERYRGFIKELVYAGRPPTDAQIHWYGTEERNAILKGRLDWLHRVVHTCITPCTAVICYNDEIAYPLIQCLRAAALRVPEDIAVVSFDNSHYCYLSPVPITSLGHERHQMGSSAALTLLAMIRGKKAHSIHLPWTLYERRSG